MKATKEEIKQLIEVFAIDKQKLIEAVTEMIYYKQEYAPILEAKKNELAKLSNENMKLLDELYELRAIKRELDKIPTMSQRDIDKLNRYALNVWNRLNKK